MNCRMCKSSRTNVVYKGNIRNGSFGNRTKETYEVVACRDCGIVYLNPFPSNLEDFYQSEKYRSSYNGKLDINKFRKSYDDNEVAYVEKIGGSNLRGKILADFGAGGGCFLDAASGLLKEGIAVEPCDLFRDTLEEKYKVFTWGRDLVKSGKKVDIATAFDVMEHVDHPLTFAQEMHKSLKEGGKAYIIVPNYDDILRYMCEEEFAQYDFRTVHLFYYRKKSIEKILKEADFSKVKVGYWHKYNLSNMLGWIKYDRPTGLDKIKLFSDQLNNLYTNELFKIGRTSHLWIEAEK